MNFNKWTVIELTSFILTHSALGSGFESRIIAPDGTVTSPIKNGMSVTEGSKVELDKGSEPVKLQFGKIEIVTSPNTTFALKEGSLDLMKGKVVLNAGEENLLIKTPAGTVPSTSSQHVSVAYAIESETAIIRNLSGSTEVNSADGKSVSLKQGDTAILHRIERSTNAVQNTVSVNIALMQASPNRSLSSTSLELAGSSFLIQGPALPPPAPPAALIASIPSFIQPVLPSAPAVPPVSGQTGAINTSGIN